MKKLPLGVVFAVFTGSTVAFASMGGWAVVSVAKVPDAWIAGKPLQLTWQVRQHGITLLDGLSPTLEASNGSRRVTGTTWTFESDGRAAYRGTIVFPEPGDWQVTINSGFGQSKAVLIPWRVVDSAGPVRGTVEEHLAKLGVASLSEAERGRRMFAALGCVTCHVHRDVGITGQLSGFGPDLSNQRFAPDYLAHFLSDPSIKPPIDGKRMPNLALKDKDIANLIAFINADRRLTRRQ
jgi:cytochrome c2